MDFSFDDDQLAYRREVRAFADRELAPHYQSDDRAARMRPELPRALASIGVTGLRIPERFGGGAADAVTTGMVAEELSRADINACYLLLITALNSDIIRDNATEQQMSRWLPPIADGTVVCALGLTERSEEHTSELSHSGESRMPSSA